MPARSIRPHQFNRATYRATYRAINPHLSYILPVPRIFLLLSPFRIQKVQDSDFRFQKTKRFLKNLNLTIPLSEESERI